MTVPKISFLSSMALVSSLVLSHQAVARQDLIPGSRYTSARSAALGDAYLPLGDDTASGLYYNPAVLGKIQKPSVELINFSVYGAQPLFSAAGLSATQVTSLPSMVSTLQNHPGQWMGAGGSLAATFGFPYFSFGILAQSQVGAQANSDDTITYRSLYQLIPAFGTGYRFMNGLVRVGYSLQWVNQSSGTVTLPSGSIQGYDQNLDKGSAFSHNLGVAITLPISSLPSFNFVVRNALNAQYTSSSWLPITPSSSTQPASDPMTMDVSLSMRRPLGQGISMSLSFVDRDLSNQSQVSFMGHLAFGAEVSVRDKLFLRGGYGSGYPSAGIGFKRKGSEFSLAWYSEEIGTSYQSVKDSRYMLQYQIRAF